MGFFGSIFKAVARGAKGIAKSAARGLKSAYQSAKRGVKAGVEKVKKLFGGRGKEKPWTEGDVPKFVDVGGSNVMAYKGGKPLTGKVIRGMGGRGRPKAPGEGSKTFSYIDNLTDPESILL